MPWSEHITTDDKILPSTDIFLNKDIVVTEKLDGENSTLARNFYHARSILDGSLTPKQAWSREWIKNLWGSIRYEIPDDMRIHGENLFAEHSIIYDTLPTYFLVFHISISDIFLSWEDVKEWCAIFNLVHVPTLYESLWNEQQIQSLWPFKSSYANKAEGYVVRVRDSFPFSQYNQNTAKFVRKGHVTGEEWFKGEWKANKLNAKI